MYMFPFFCSYSPTAFITHSVCFSSGNMYLSPAWMGVFGEAQAYRLKSSVLEASPIQEDSDAR